MQWSLASHPYRREVVGGVNSYAVALTNWLVVGGMIYGIIWIMSADMTPAQVAETSTIDGKTIYSVDVTPAPVFGAIGGITPQVLTGGLTTPTVTPTPDLDNNNAINGDINPYWRPNIIELGYSYYDPRLGGVNCIDFRDEVCQSPLGNGEAWQDYIYARNTVAMPPDIMSSYGVDYGDVIIVIAPDEIVGSYVVRDICTGCNASNWADNRPRIDFLDVQQRLPWNTNIYAVIP